MTTIRDATQVIVKSALQTGTIDEVDGEGVVVALPSGAFRAQLAVSGGYAAAAGDEVLVASDAEDKLFVIAVLKPALAPQRVATTDGMVARVERDGEGEVMRVADREGKLILEHRVASGVTVLRAAGDLELRADAGSIRMVARDGVEMRSASARVAAKDITLEGDLVSVTAQRLRQTVGALETQAARILERAKNVYRDVEELAQTRAGRIKFVAEKTFHALGQRTLFKAKEDVKIKGEKIYLA